MSEAAVENLAAELDDAGFVIIPQAIDSAVVEQLLEALQTAKHDAVALRRRDDVYGMRDLLKRIPAVRQFAQSAVVRDLVVPILGPAAFVVRGLLFDKTQDANWNVPWHRDQTIAVRERVDVPGFGPWTRKAGIAHVQPPRQLLSRMLTMRVHLDDSPADNGPLQVLPGSHLLDDEAVERARGALPPTVCAVPRGGVLLMRPLLVHSSAVAQRPGHRRVIHLEFASERLPGGLDWYEAYAFA